MLRPLTPASLDEFPAAAEAKLEVKGEGMMMGNLRTAALGRQVSENAANRASLFDDGLGREWEMDSVIVGREYGSQNLFLR